MTSDTLYEMDEKYFNNFKQLLNNVSLLGSSAVSSSIREELTRAFSCFLAKRFKLKPESESNNGIIFAVQKDIEEIAAGNAELEAALNKINFEELNSEGYIIKYFEENDLLIVTSKTDKGLLYGTFALFREIQQENNLKDLDILSNPKNNLRMLNHWDNLDGSIERGYAGKSIFYKDNNLRNDLTRIKDYARMLASIGINALSINNPYSIRKFL